MDKAEFAAIILHCIVIFSPISSTEPLQPLPAIPRGSLVILWPLSPHWQVSQLLDLTCRRRNRAIQLDLQAGLRFNPGQPGGSDKFFIRNAASSPILSDGEKN